MRRTVLVARSLSWIGLALAAGLIACGEQREQVQVQQEPVDLVAGKAAIQSTTAFGPQLAEFAIDGDLSTFSVTEPNFEPWWQVDLGAVATIARIRVRGGPSTPFHVFVSDVPFACSDIASAITQPGVLDIQPQSPSPGDDVTFSVNRSGRYVRIQLEGGGNLLLGEVNVLGHAAPGAPRSNAAATPTAFPPVDRDTAADRELTRSHVINTVVVNYVPVGASIPATVVLRGPRPSYAGPAHFDCDESPDLCPGSDPTGAMVEAYLHRLADAADVTARFLTDATRYRAYAFPSPSATPAPALEYKIVDTVTVLQPRIAASKCSLWPENEPAPLGQGLLYGFSVEGGYPRGNFNRFDPDVGANRHAYALPYIFDLFVDLCTYVRDRNVRFVLLASLFDRTDQKVESLSAGKYGNIGNSNGHLGLYCRDGHPIPAAGFEHADATYHVYTYSVRPRDFDQFATGVHNFLHHLETLIINADVRTPLNGRPVFVDEFFGHFASPFDGTIRPNSHRFGTTSEPPRVLEGQCLSTAWPSDLYEPVSSQFGIDICLDVANGETNTIRINAVGPIPDRVWPTDVTDSDPPLYPDLAIPADGSPQTIPYPEGSGVAYRLVSGKDVKIRIWGGDGGAFMQLFRPSYDFGSVQRCGEDHFPPNGETNYDYGNSNWTVRTDCRDWRPDQSGTIESYTCRTLQPLSDTTTAGGCHVEPAANGEFAGTELEFYKAWMQSLPGPGNRIRWSELADDGEPATFHMRDIWEFIADYQGALDRRPATFIEEAYDEVAPPSNLVLSRAAGGVRLTWTPSPAAAGYNIFRRRLADAEYVDDGKDFRVNDVLFSGTTYLDTFRLQDGAQYAYLVKAVDANGLQSFDGASGNVAVGTVAADDPGGGLHDSVEGAAPSAPGAGAGR